MHWVKHNQGHWEYPLYLIKQFSMFKPFWHGRLAPDNWQVSIHPERRSLPFSRQLMLKWFEWFCVPYSTRSRLIALITVQRPWHWFMSYRERLWWRHLRQSTGAALRLRLSAPLIPHPTLTYWLIVVESRGKDAGRKRGGAGQSLAGIGRYRWEGVGR